MQGRSVRDPNKNCWGARSKCTLGGLLDTMMCVLRRDDDSKCRNDSLRPGLHGAGVGLLTKYAGG